ncbi:hypothetical protein D3C86_1703250 [compost metagenome]
MCHNAPDEKFAPACTGNSGSKVIGISACTDKGRITYPAIFFIGHATCRSSRRKVSHFIKGYCANSSKFIVVVNGFRLHRFFIAMVKYSLG